MQFKPFCMWGLPLIAHAAEVAMSRFYFHVQAEGQVVLDHEGTDLPDLSAAQCEAMESAREVLADAIKRGKSKVATAFVIADEAGRALAIVPLLAVLPRKN
jgi:hypothetical protein